MATSGKFRRARLIVIALAVVLVAAVAGGVYYGVDTVQAAMPQTTGSISIPGLQGRVQVDRDKNGIPQIYASNSHDLFLAQGFVQAQDRFWEMDTRRHITSGRLSEMFGASQVKTDAFLRTMNWHGVAQQEWDHKLSPDTKANLRAYTAGVNGYLAHHSGSALSLEYKILGLDGIDYKPAKWSPVDSVAWLKAMAWDLRSNMQDEITRAELNGSLSKQEIKELYPPYPYGRNKPIMSTGAVGADGAFHPKASPAAGTSNGATSAIQGDASARAALGRVQDRLNNATKVLGTRNSGTGSNSWVVSGKHTTTGKPLLANDPHLSPALPSVWYQMGLHCTVRSAACPYDVSGFTFSGMPGVVIGHNNAVSWGFTNLAPDVSDLYLEKISDGRALYNGRYEPLKERHETIKVAGGKARSITVRSTRNGPLISDRDDDAATVGKTAAVPGGEAPDARSGYAVSLRWTALVPNRTMDAVFTLDRAQNFTEFRKAAAAFAVPAQNLVYADTRGNIGYQAPGLVPVRGKGDGSVPAPGWDPAYRWKSWIPTKALPWEENPSSGYIVTANQAVVGKDYKYLLTTDWGYGNRSQRITDLIRSKLRGGGLISPDDMSSMQMDAQNSLARTLTPYLQKVKISDPYVKEAQDLLKGWNHQQDPDSGAAAYYNAVWRNLLKITFGEKLPASVRPKGQCVWVTPHGGGSAPVDDLSGKPKKVRECGKRDPDEAEPDGGDRWAEVVRNILPDAGNHWWHAPRTFEGRTIGQADGRDAVLAEAMKDARYELTAKLGKDTSTWTWGRLHKLDLKNQTIGTSGPSLIRQLLNRGPYEMGGGSDTVDANGWNAAAGYGVDQVPSMRMVVDLSDLDRSRWINLTGASGHAFNDHYTDQAAKWQQGKTLPWAYGPSAVRKATVDRLTLKPSG